MPFEVSAKGQATERPFNEVLLVAARHGFLHCLPPLSAPLSMTVVHRMQRTDTVVSRTPLPAPRNSRSDQQSSSTSDPEWPRCRPAPLWTAHIPPCL